ncbi:MAG TPA: PAS domain-containing protein [Chitinophagaceae bacterium]|nr:PAS domain-containing protein [Chitinophagaceae bacterium]
MLKTSAFFDSFCKNAKHNAVLIMDTKGIILEVNNAFLTSFGYTQEDVLQKNFSILFTNEDRNMNKPGRELERALLEGSGSDDNYLVQKSGTPVWVNGESILVKDEDDISFIIKIIHNIEAQKQLERFLLQSNDFIDTIFESITDRGLIVLDSGIKVIKVNSKFAEMFGLNKLPAEGSRVGDLGHPFWNSAEIKQVLRNILVKDEPVTNMLMSYTSGNAGEINIALTSRILHTTSMDKRILLVVNPV